MRIFNDIYKLISALRFVDIVFFFSILILMILIIVLIYFIKINKIEEDEEKKNLEETQEMRIAREIKESMNNSEKTIEFTDYEKDQENKAIISYEELINKKNNNYGLNYVEEEIQDDLSIKKVDLDNLVNKSNNSISNIEVRVISFQKEEAFLEALKRLQKELG